jgi:sugar lactone lactonase YvrE
MSKATIAPVSWRPAAAPPRARKKSSAVPMPPMTVVPVGGHGPEDVLVGQEGEAYTGTADGRIRRVRLGSPSPTAEVLADTGGRPLGLEWLPDGRLLVCDAHRGLLAVDLNGSGRVEVLATEADGARLRVCNNAAVAPDGTVYFTDSTAHFDLEDWRADIFEHSGTGRFLRRDPDGRTSTLATGLQFANGVALSPSGDSVFFAETGLYRVSRLFLSGPRQGETQVVLDNLPGFPDNISTGSDGLIWVALASPRDAIVDLLAPAPAWLRKAAWAMPEALQPKPKLYGWTVSFDPATGSQVHDLQGRATGFGMSTGVREFDGQVWLSSLIGNALATFSLR